MSATQATLHRSIRIEGHGLHSGLPCTLTLNPAPEHHGITFTRVDLPGTPPIPATFHYLTARDRRTAIAREGADVHTIEHLLSALRGLGVDNVSAEVDAIELPGGDGSAKIFTDAILAAEVAVQKAPRRVLRINQPQYWVEKHVTLVALPPLGDEFAVAYTLDYPHPKLKAFVEYTLSPTTYAAEIAPARTFVLEAEARALQAAGLGKGATTDNTLVIGDNGPIGNTLRFPDECARHKVLDLIGDFALAGVWIQARVIAIRSGHAANGKLIQRLVESPSNAVTV